MRRELDPPLVQTATFEDVKKFDPKYAVIEKGAAYPARSLPTNWLIILLLLTLFAFFFFAFYIKLGDLNNKDVPVNSSPPVNK